MELFLFMTLSASLLILAALLLRPLTGRILPSGLQMGMWIAASLRLLLPFRITAPFSFFTLFTKNENTLEQTAMPTAQSTQYSLITAASSEAAITHPVVSFAPQPVEAAVPPDPLTLTEVLPWIWLAGVLLTAGVLLFLHLREAYRYRFKTSDTETERLVPHFVRVYRCEAISAPFVSGLLMPKICLPESTPAEDLPVVLAHELAHIRGLDLLKKYLFAAALCVNWFNPLVWVMVRLAGQDMELLCDRRALLGPDAPDPKTYAHSLLNAEERRTLFALGFKSNTEARIMRVLKKEKTNRFAALLSFLLVLLLTAGCVTQPIASASQVDPLSASSSKSADDIKELLIAEALKEFLLQNGRFGLGDLHIGEDWEQIKETILAMENSVYPILKEGLLTSSVTSTTIPFSLLGYDGSLSLYFVNGVLSDMICDFTFENMDTAIMPYYSMLTSLRGALGGDGPLSLSGANWTQGKTALSIHTVADSKDKSTWNTVRLHIAQISEIKTTVTASKTPGDYSSQLLNEAMASGSTDDDLQNVINMYLDIRALESSIEQQERQLTNLQDQYIQTVLQFDAQDAYREAVLDQLNHGIAVDQALKSAGLDQGLQTVEKIRADLPDLSGKRIKHLTIRNEDGTSVLTEIDLPYENLYIYYEEITSAFAFYNAQFTITDNQ